MVPTASASARPSKPAPRTRGDGPEDGCAFGTWKVCSPHPRGWSPARRRRHPAVDLLPAPAGMVPVLVPTVRSVRHCSPHPRGWSQLFRVPQSVHELLPAPAGMVPRPCPARRGRSPAPRTRGDGPWSAPGKLCGHRCSPHPRGWSLDDGRPGRGEALLPAPAGMVPPERSPTARPGAAPRTRGDGPAAAGHPATRTRCSPHPRGWSLRRRTQPVHHELLPAPAGMVPISAIKAGLPKAAPRTRGDGPGP